MIGDDFYQLALTLLVAVALGAFAMLLRQPLVIAFIIVGVLIGPAVLGWVSDRDQIDFLAQIGIAILLFLVGLKLDLHLIRTTGPVAVVTALTQMACTTVGGFGLALLFGVQPDAALLIAVALAFSSTIIVVKLLSDSREFEELHGRVAVGVLIVQDVVVILVMIVLTAIGGTSGHSGGDGVLVIAKAIGLLALVGLLMRFVLGPLLDQLARSHELLVLFAIAWAVGLAAGAEWLGLSKELGAFVGGVSLASTPYREAIGARLVGLRNFLLLFFFIDLGARLQLPETRTGIAAAVALSAFVLIGKPIFVMATMGLLGYPKRVSFRSGVALAQISEFSLILAALGFRLGYLDRSDVGLITTIALVTIAVSTYGIGFSLSLYARLAPFLGIFERRHPTRGTQAHDEREYDAIVLGAGRFGSSVVDGLAATGARVLVVDYDPHALTHARGDGVDTLYGDAEEPELLDSLPLGAVASVVSTIPSVAVGLVVLETLRQRSFRGTVALTAHTDHDAAVLRAADDHLLVLRPFSVAAERVLAHILDAADDEPGPDAAHDEP